MYERGRSLCCERNAEAGCQRAWNAALGNFSNGLEAIAFLRQHGLSLIVHRCLAAKQLSRLRFRNVLCGCCTSIHQPL